MSLGQGLLYVFPLLVSGLMGAWLAFFILRNRRTPSSKALLVLVLASALWSAGYAMEILSPGLEAKLFWAKLQYIGIAAAPLAWAVFSLRYFEAPLWTHKLHYQVLLGLFPVLTILLAWTNELHGLLWQAVFLQPLGPLQVLGVRYGPWFYLHLIFSYGMLVWGSTRLVGGMFSSARLYRWQIGLALVAIGIPWLANLLYISGLNPIPHLDWTPFAFIIAGLLLITSLFRFHLIEILPIAQKMVFSELPDCLLVVDRRDYLVDMNRAAEVATGMAVEELCGRPVTDALPELAAWLKQAALDGELQAEMTLAQGSASQHYQVRIAPLSSHYPLSVGRLIVCHEITEQKQQQARLEKAVEERTQDLKLAVVQLQNQLAERALAERRFAQMVESAPDAMVLVDQDGQIQLVNAQVEHLLGYQRQDLLGKNYESLIHEQYLATLNQVVDQFAADTNPNPHSLLLQIDARHKDGHLFPLEISMGKLETAGGFWITCNLRDISERVRHEQAQARLLERIRRSRMQLSALALRLEEVQEAEQRRIALELHDRVGQNLTGLNLNLQAIQGILSPAETVAFKRLEDSLLLVEETTRQVRDLMAELDPPLLREYGLLAALRFLGERFEARTGIDLVIAGQEVALRLPPRSEMALFRIVQECLTNIVKHARATQVRIHYTLADQTVLLSVEDNGVGFESQELPPVESQPTWGLVAIQERAAAIGGVLEIDSSPGQGARIQIKIERGA